jgi:hypothetical protein
VEKLKYLEFDTLIKELDFIESEIKFKSELIRNIDSKFMESVTHFLDAHPHLKVVYENQMNFNLSKSEKLISEEKESEDDLTEDVELVDDIDENVKSNSKIKTLYRQIVKLTHPDKSGNQNLNHFYSEATEAYKSSELFSIYKICQKLNLSVDFSEEEILEMREKIKSGRERLKFLETTYTYQWWHENLELSKEKIILSYIKEQLVRFT